MQELKMTSYSTDWYRGVISLHWTAPPDNMIQVILPIDFACDLKIPLPIPLPRPYYQAYPHISVLIIQHVSSLLLNLICTCYVTHTEHSS